MAKGQEHGPLILGATGRLGRAFRQLWAAGLWPDSAQPLWQYRGNRPLSGNAIGWDLLTEPAPIDPRLQTAQGVIVLAGVTTGTPDELARNTYLALAAIDLAARYGLGPVLLCSSAAVYGRAAGAQSETMPCQPANPYGTAKLAMEAAVAGKTATCLRIANVAGSDQLFDAAARGPVRLDQFPDRSGPERAYIGPLTLARVMLALIDLHQGGKALPGIINIAAPLPVAMQALLQAADVPFDWTPAPATALASVTLDTARLAAIVPLSADTAAPATLVAQAHAAGWKAAGKGLPK